MGFGEIASLYDRFNDLAVYEHWADYTLRMHEEQPIKRLLDVGCGTGWFLELMEPYADEMVGLDIDPAMLDQARQASPSDKITWVEADMTAMPFADAEFDVVVSYLDSLNFLESIDQVEQALKEMYRVLQPGGICLFDVITPTMLTAYYQDFSHHDSDEYGALMWDSFVDEEALTVSHYLTGFDRNEDGSYHRIEVDLFEQTYPLDEWLQVIERAGFTVAPRMAVAQGMVDYDPEQHGRSERWFFCCVKA